MNALTLVLGALIVGQDEFPAIGTNLAPVTPATTQWPFLDAMKVSSPWVGKTESGEAAKLEIDANGDVKSLKPGQFAETVFYTSGHNPVGKYVLSWEGKGAFAAGSGGTLEDVQANKATLNVTGDKGFSLQIRQVDPADPPRNIRLMTPGHEEDEGTFHPIFLQRMSLYRALRFADWGGAASPVKEWSERPTVGQRTYADGRGVPLEVMIDLANAKFSIPWLCVPYGASDDYVRNMAMLVRQRLHADLKVIVEYGSGGDQPGSSQAAYFAEQGAKLKLGANDLENGRRFRAQRGVEVIKVFREAFGANERVVRVMTASFGDLNAAADLLKWNKAANQFDAVAIDPFFGQTATSDTLDGLFGKLDESVGETLSSKLDDFARLAKQNALRLFAYAGGQAMAVPGAGTVAPETSAALNTLYDQANRDKRMRDLYVKYLKAWRRAGGSLFMHYLDCAPYTATGRFGTIEYQDQDPQTSYKNQGLIQYSLFPDR